MSGEPETRWISAIHTRFKESERRLSSRIPRACNRHASQAATDCSSATVRLIGWRRQYVRERQAHSMGPNW